MHSPAVKCNANAKGSAFPIAKSVRLCPEHRTITQPWATAPGLQADLFLIKMLEVWANATIEKRIVFWQLIKIWFKKRQPEQLFSYFQLQATIMFRPNMKWLIQTNVSRNSEPSPCSCLSDYLCQARTFIGIQELLCETASGGLYPHISFSSCDTLCMLIETLPDESIHAPEV